MASGRITFFIALAFALFMVGGGGLAHALFLTDVRVGQHGDKTRFVLEMDKSASFRVFVLDAPYRVVVDVPRAAWKTTPAEIGPNPLIRGYRSGTLDGGVMRLVLDAARPLDILPPVLLASGNGIDKYRLVIDFMPSTPERFLSLKGKIFGSRDLAVSPSPSPVKTPALSAAPPAPRVAAPPAPVSAPGPVAMAPSRKPLSDNRKRTIVIDAGHGGGDPGAIGVKNIIEKNVTLAMARELKRQLEATGRYRAVLTRSDDTYIPLRKRVDLAHLAQGDLFISLHADKIGRRNVRGASIYTLSEKSSDEETARLADDANNSGILAGVDLSSQTEEVADILLDLAMREKMNQSNYFAELMVRTLRANGVLLLEHAHRSAGFAVLKSPDIPAVLIELGFLSNPDEARLLNSESFRKSASAALASGVDAYFRKIQSLQRN